MDARLVSIGRQQREPVLVVERGCPTIRDGVDHLAVVVAVEGIEVHRRVGPGLEESETVVTPRWAVGVRPRSGKGGRPVWTLVVDRLERQGRRLRGEGPAVVPGCASDAPPYLAGQPQHQLARPRDRDIRGEVVDDAARQMLQGDPIRSEHNERRRRGIRGVH